MAAAAPIMADERGAALGIAAIVGRCRPLALIIAAGKEKSEERNGAQCSWLQHGRSTKTPAKSKTMATRNPAPIMILRGKRRDCNGGNIDQPFGKRLIRVTVSGTGEC